MEEGDQEQRYVCKICRKSCVSGRSLGGHMRIHLAQISASKKAANFENQTDPKDEDSDFSDDDDENASFQFKENYELRENPKKSWRISDLKIKVSKDEISCKECGKEFSSSRALSGHMRCHSSKNKCKEIEHNCKTCGKGFDSIMAMFGHMKTHSKKSRVADDSLTELANLCPVRRKRSRIRYNVNPKPSFSSLNEFVSDVSELMEVELAAEGLMMLSRGMWDSIKLDSVMESSDEDSDYSGVESSCEKNKKISDYLCDLDKFAAKNKLKVGFNDPDFEFAVKNKMKVETYDDWMPSTSVGNGNFGITEFTEVDKDLFGVSGIETISAFLKFNSCKKAGVSVQKSDYGKNISDKLAAENKMKGKTSISVNGNCTDGSRVLNSKKLSEFDKDMFVISGKEKTISELLKSKSSKKKSVYVQESDCGKSFVEKHECPICLKVFRSGQALGGHKMAHYTGFNESPIKEVRCVNPEIDGFRDLLISR